MRRPLFRICALSSRAALSIDRVTKFIGIEMVKRRSV